MESDNNLCCFTCSIILFSISLLALIITYIVFAIIGLVRTSLNIESELCHESNLWIYVLVSLILFLKINNVITIFKKPENDGETKYFQFLVEFGISLSMFIWGAYELFGVKCVNNLNNTILYKCAFGYWITSTILLGIIVSIIIIGLFTLIYVSFKENISNYNNLQDNNKNTINNLQIIKEVDLESNNKI